MGYDPPTHQVWVKLVGLPLQAWTVSEVTAILRKFGHPLQVLPFGQAAGHHRDITALIATMHPRRIPLAYRYMEGDYSTQFDVMILSWRLWEDDDFPPPGYPMLQEDPYHQPHQQNNQMDADNHSSSSSSNDAPSEPTIDLSAWSPRSYRLSRSYGSEPNGRKKWVPVLGKSQQKTRRNSASTQLTEQPHTSPSAGKAIFSGNDQIIPQSQKRQQLATEDPTCPHNLQWISPPTQTYILSIKTPIHITPPLLSYLVNQQHNRTMRSPQLLRVDQNNPTLPLRNSLIQYKHQGEDNTSKDIIIAKAYKNPRQVILQALQSCRPIVSPIPLQLQSPTQNGPLLITDQADTPKLLLFHPQGRHPSLSLNTDFESPHIPDDTAYQHLPTPLEIHQTGSTTGYNEAISAFRPISVPVPTMEATRSSSHATIKKRKKEKQLPTRRSRRIQARQQESPINTDPLPAAKSNAARIPFNLDDTINSLDVSITVSLLQATGLHITDQVKQMIEQAANQDKTNEHDERLTPSTPLHDPIPPLTIPGTDIVL